MVHIPDLTLSDVGRWVIYHHYGRAQRGRIKGWNDDNVFVVYQCGKDWDRYLDFTAQATNPADLDFKE
jgi:hypothetical protein